MTQTNKVTLSGNLVKKPEIKALENGTEFCTFSIAVNNNYEKDGQKINEPSFFNGVAYGDVANQIKDLEKGSELSVSGKVIQKKFEKDGQVKFSTEIYAFEVNDKAKKQSAFIELAGNLVAEPEFKTFDSGKTKCSFTIINNNEYESKSGETKKDNTALTVELWNQAAESVKHAKKGSLMKIKGFLNQSNWVKDGVKHSSIKINAYEAELLFKKEKKVTEPELGR